VDELTKSIESLTYNEAGLIPAIVVDADSGDVLMMAWMNAQALRTTIETGRTHFWSRSRKKYWMKGESSGHVQEVQAIYTDCDKDVLLVKVRPHGPACHEGYRSCFYRRLSPGGAWEVVAEKVFDPGKVYKGRP